MAAEDIDNLFITDIQSPSEASFDDPESALRNAYRYLKNLPKVEPSELPADKRDCEICLEAYGTNGLDEKAVQLSPCGHKFGFDCIFEWLSPTNIPNRNTCPKCRAVLFEMDHSGWSDDEEYDTDTEEAPDSFVIPELRALLNLQRIDSFVAALDFIETYFRGANHLPEGLSRSRQMYAIFRAFPPAPAADEIAPTEAVIQETAVRVARLMGLMYVSFGGIMEFMQNPIPWRENGPPVHELLDPGSHARFETWILHFMNFEDRFGRRPLRTRALSN